MQIRVFSIQKGRDELIDSLIKEYMKMIKKSAKIDDIVLFNKQVAQAQTKGEIEAKNSYRKVFEPYLRGYSIALDIKGDEIDSYEFSKIFDKSSEINFFIGGAYGFEESFLRKTQKVISLSRLTFAHKIAKVVLYEQIYRGLCIKGNHPYHKYKVEENRCIKMS
jgi:23S rRNA (pseudouridine1915-N3)-methyltransferase